MNPTQSTINCPRCGASNRASAKFCGTCQTPLQNVQPSPTASPTAPEATPAPPPSPETMPLAPTLTASSETKKLADDKTPFVERATRRLDDATGFADLPVGALIAGKYEVRQLFSAQAGVNSYLVADAQSNFSVLFEAEKPDYWAGEKKLFELNIAHPNIATLGDVFEEIQYGDQPRGYLLTEYPMSPLTQLGAPNEYDLLSWGKQLAEALAYLHDHNLAHGNVQKTGSIVVTGSKQVKLWNLAETRPLTPEARMFDVFKLAQTLVQLVAPNGQLAIALSPATQQIFTRALGDQRQRYPDARAFIADLDNALNLLRHPQGITLTVGRMTDVGRKRELNEDALVTIDLAQFVQQGSQAVGLFVVADGMGGAAAGEVASKLVTQAMARSVLQNVFPQRVSEPPANLDYKTLVRKAAEQANEDVFKARSAARTDMGSTLVAALVVGNQAYLVNVGDARAYLIAPDRIEKITKDHSLVQAFVDRKEIGEDDVYTHPQRNFILRNVGDKATVQADTFVQSFNPGEYLLLCSDGLWEMVYPKKRLQEIVLNAPSVREACQQLIDAANAHGGDDNITVVLVKFEAV